MVNSMTGFAALKGSLGQSRWSFEIRSVNARGMDLRFRLPEGQEALEPLLRAAIAKTFARGAITCGLRLQTDSAPGRMELNSEQLDVVLAALKTVEARADEQNVTLAHATGAELLALKGVFDQSENAAMDPARIQAALKDQIAPLLAAFSAARADEGKALHDILSKQLARIVELVGLAAEAAEERNAQMRETMQTNLAKLLDNTDGLEEGRLMQELALLAVKADVSEELDRLTAHIKAADALLAEKGPVGRKFDFLMQEFNREANTLCSKSGATALTQIGLDLKTVIDQMREQVQNVE